MTTHAPKLYTVHDVLACFPEPPTGRKPGKRIIMNRARELQACVEFSAVMYFTNADIDKIIESFRPCSNLSNVTGRNFGSRAGQSTASELSEAQNALEKAMQKSNAGGSKTKSKSSKVVKLKRS